MTEARVAFTRAPFDSIAAVAGFIPQEDSSGWYLQGGDVEAREHALVRGPRTILVGSRLERVFSATGEGATEDAATYLSVLRRADGCALVLMLSLVGAAGSDLQPHAVLRTLSWRR